MVKSLSTANHLQQIIVAPATQHMSNYSPQIIREWLSQDVLKLPKIAIQQHYEKICSALTISSHPCCYLAIRDHKPCGIILGTHPEAGVATIIWLLVCKHYHNSGIGRKLLEYAIQKYQHSGTVHKIKLTTNNTAAKLFYEHLGWQTEGLHQKHWYELDFWSLSYFI